MSLRDRIRKIEASRIGPAVVLVVPPPLPRDTAPTKAEKAALWTRIQEAERNPRCCIVIHEGELAAWGSVSGRAASRAVSLGEVTANHSRGNAPTCRRG
jgi:hypothetical protein